jgi:di/tricarboxylate transporter
MNVVAKHAIAATIGISMAILTAYGGFWGYLLLRTGEKSILDLIFVMLGIPFVFIVAFLLTVILVEKAI